MSGVRASGGGTGWAAESEGQAKATSATAPNIARPRWTPPASLACNLLRLTTRTGARYTNRGRLRHLDRGDLFVSRRVTELLVAMIIFASSGERDSPATRPAAN
jgi:hypothetical protein